MKNYVTLFVTQLIVIGMAINIRTDIPFWKQCIGYVVIALIVPFAKFMENSHGEGNEIKEKSNA